MISADGDAEDEVVPFINHDQTANSEGQDVKGVRKRPSRPEFKPEDMGYKGTILGIRQGGSLRPFGTSLDCPGITQVARLRDLAAQVARLRDLAAQHADDSGARISPSRGR